MGTAGGGEAVGMTLFFIRRLAAAIAVLAGAATVMFLVLRLSGDPARLLLPPQASDEERVALQAQLGLDRSLPQQYLIYMRNLAKGDFGTSYRSGYPALELAAERLPYTLALAGATFIFIVIVSIPLGIVAARQPGTLVDRAVVLLCTAGQAIPVFVTGTFFILFFSVYLRWVPSSGASYTTSLILPALTLGLYSMGRTARLVRSGMVAALQEDYVRTARAKGVSDIGVLFGHALKNVLIPVVTMLGLEAGGLFGRAVIVEVVFAWPGLGRLIVDSVLARDYAVAQAGVIIIAAIYTFLNAVVDILYYVIDPRLRTTT